MSRAPRKAILHRAGWTDGLSTRTANALRASGIDSRDALAAFPRQRLCSIPALGETSLAEIDAWLGRSAARDEAPPAPRRPARRRASLRLTLHLDADQFGGSANARAPDAVARAADAIVRELMRLLDTDGGTGPPPGTLALRWAGRSAALYS